MEKRLLLTLVISLMVILAWSTLMSKFYHVEKQEVVEKRPSYIVPPEKSLAQDQDIKELSEDVSLEKINIDDQEFIFSLPSCTLQAVLFKKYQNYKFSLQTGFWLKDKDFAFKTKNLGTEPTFIYEDLEKRIIKRFLLHKSKYVIGLEIVIQNLSSNTLNIDYPLVLGRVDLSGRNLDSRFQEAVISQKERLYRFNLRSNFYSPEELRFLAIRDRYFCAIIQPELPGFRGFINKFNNKEAEAGLLYENKILPGADLRLNFLIYIGPQQLSILEGINKDWSSVIHYGAFDYISKLLLKLLSFLHSLVHNWGAAVILLSLFIYFILFPLTLKQMHSMKKMQELQPKIEGLRKLYKDNSQRLNKEIMELYKKEKINPFSGCLPLVLQIPIFFALYQSLIRSLELKGANFLWIKDLSEPDRLIMLANPLPILGNEINLLPILMMSVMFLQQKLTATTAASASQEQQRLMQVLFPLLFGVIFYHMPSGLVLYWFINSLLLFVYQSRIKLQH